jgi:hypothetical protein
MDTRHWRGVQPADLVRINLNRFPVVSLSIRLILQIGHSEHSSVAGLEADARGVYLSGLFHPIEVLYLRSS